MKKRKSKGATTTPSHIPDLNLLVTDVQAIVSTGLVSAQVSQLASEPQMMDGATLDELMKKQKRTNT